MTVMRILLKRLAYLLLTLALTNMSVLAVYAGSIHHCDSEKNDQQSLQQTHHQTPDHCQHKQSTKNCSCDNNCGCGIHIISQATFLPEAELFLFRKIRLENTSLISHQYSKDIFNPLLRPPTA